MRCELSPAMATAASLELWRLLLEVKERAGSEMRERGVMGERWRSSWRATAQRGLVGQRNADARPPHGGRCLNRSVTVDHHQSSDFGLTVRLGDLQSPNP